MTDDRVAPQPETLDEDALRRRLISRIALAGLAIVGLLGGLAVIDNLYVAPIAVTPNRPKHSSIVESEPVPTNPALSSVDVIPVQTEAPPEPPNPKAVPLARSVPESPVRPRSHAKLPVPLHLSKAAEDDVTGPTTPLRPAPSAQPPARNTKPARQFVLQMGVFNNVDNAMELLATLQKGGVPAQIEARVQVGPFKNKFEADLARGKLEAMGLAPGLLMAIRK